MRRREAIAFLGAAALAWPAAGLAQQPGARSRIGYLAPVSPQLDGPIQRAFLIGLRERGYVVGENCTLLPRLASGRIEQLPRLAAELVQLKADVIVAGSSAAAAAAISVTRDTPVVFFAVTDPVSRGLVISLARPGGNATGISNDVSALVAVKRLELLKEIAPSIARIAVLGSNDLPGQPPWDAELGVMARALGVSLRSYPIQSSEQLAPVLAQLLRDDSDAVFPAPSVLTFEHRKRIADFALENRMPAVFPWREAAEAGALMSYGQDIKGSAHRAAYFVDKILKGAKPGELPVEQPTKFEFVVNLRTARKLGLSVPDSVLARAEEVLE